MQNTARPILLPLVALVVLAGLGCRSTESTEATATDPTSPAESLPPASDSELEPIPFDDIFSEFRVFETLNPMIEVWTLHGDVAVARNTSEEESYFVIGYEEWQDFVVELDALFPVGQPLRLGVSSAVIGESLEFGMTQIRARHDDWHRLRIEVEGGRVRITDLDDGATFFDEATPFPSGGLALHVPPGEQMALRNIRARVDRELPFTPPDPTPPLDEGDFDDLSDDGND